MLNVDISNIWCRVSLPDLLAVENDLKQASAEVRDGPSPILGWLDQTEAVRRMYLREIAVAAERIRKTSRTLVVIGAGLNCAGAAAAAEIFTGTRRSPMRILLLGDSYSPEAWLSIEQELEQSDFSVLLTAENGMETLPLVIMRSVRWVMEKRYGVDFADRVYVVSPARQNVLSRLAVGEKWQKLDAPELPWGDRSTLNPAGLLILAAAGLDPVTVYQGAAAMYRTCAGQSFENPAWLYAGARYILMKSGAASEHICVQNPYSAPLAGWWARVFCADCRGGKGCAADSFTLPGDFFRCGNLLLDGSRGAFSTVIRLPQKLRPVPVEMDWKNLDGIDPLAGYKFHELEEKTAAAIQNAMIDREVPLIGITSEKPMEDAQVGALLCFAEYTASLFAALCGSMAEEDDYPRQALRALDAELGCR